MHFFPGSSLAEAGIYGAENLVSASCPSDAYPVDIKLIEASLLL